MIYPSLPVSDFYCRLGYTRWQRVIFSGNGGNGWIGCRTREPGREGEVRVEIGRKERNFLRREERRHREIRARRSSSFRRLSTATPKLDILSRKYRPVLNMFIHRYWYTTKFIPVFFSSIILSSFCHNIRISLKNKTCVQRINKLRKFFFTNIPSLIYIYSVDIFNWF